ncbi:MAG: GatB/YqeY domain-containing protein [Bacteroidales bacterium]|nr:GatB/YqeY domain-containing protein [Bacteroidales bacterium]MDD6581430.1 GatB/YqeY domain-containing protein [Bacteroidales bacterium]
MSLEEKVMAGIKAAMLAKDQRALEALRAVKAEILLLKTAKDAKPITEDVELKLLQRLAKQRQEAADIYKNSGREDLAAEELAQLKVITQFLPAQMSEEEITAALKQLIADNNISGIKEMGKLMGLASKQFAGKADNKLVSQIVKQLLS